MSKTNDWLLGMQEDAEHMTLNEFIQEHGESNSVVDVWKTTQERLDVEFSISEQRLEEFLDAQGEGE
jgi:hypothetical protein|tara:strand:- start:2175 stop:2375 length:201 start_codon:yes stop_codon:yes gene_type:complete